MIVIKNYFAPDELQIEGIICIFNNSVFFEVHVCGNKRTATKKVFSH